MYYQGIQGLRIWDVARRGWFQTGEAAEYIYSHTLWTPSVACTRAKDYYDKFVVKYNTPPGYGAAQAYAAMYVISDALKSADP